MKTVKRVEGSWLRVEGKKSVPVTFSELAAAEVVVRLKRAKAFGGSRMNERAALVTVRELFGALGFVASPSAGRFVVGAKDAAQKITTHFGEGRNWGEAVLNVSEIQRREHRTSNAERPTSNAGLEMAGVA